MKSSGSQRYRRRVLVLAVMFLKFLVMYSSAKEEHLAATEDTTTSNRVEQHLSLRHQRRKLDEPQRHSEEVAASPRLLRDRRNNLTPRIVTGSEVSSSTRIINGAESSSYPYFILWGGCAATLIHNDIALSAAHCSRRKEAKIGPRP